MAYSVYFFTFSKKMNSTAQPTLTAGVKFDCRLMDASGILDPSVIIDSRNLGSGQPQSFNYAYIPEFSRYYYINEWSYMDGLWSCSMSVDVLASWKTPIGNYSGYVLRSSYSSNGQIKDTFYPAKTNPTHSVKIINLSWADELSDGRYVVGVISGNTSNLGSVSYYVMTPVEFNSFCNAIFANTSDWLDTANITDISTELLKTLFNPFDYIVSAMWFPFTVPSDGTSVSSVPLGWWSVPASAARLYSEAVVFFDYSFTPDAHPQAATRGAYLNSAPYTTLTLDFQPFGMIPLDASIVCGSTLTLNVYVDYITGTACLHITQDSGSNILYSSATQVGVPVQISGRQPNIASMIAGAISQSFTNSLSSGGLISDVAHVVDRMGSELFGKPSISGTVSNIANAAAEGLKRVTSTGSNGSRAQILPEAYLAQDYLILTDEDNSHFGRPLYTTAQISTIPGYIQMGDADLSFAGIKQEIVDVQNFLKSGFFYE